MEPEAIDDAQLLSAIERAWPVPPMTGQLINRDISNLSIEPQTGSFSAPLAPLPRFQPRRTWSSFTRIAAVLALLLTSVVGVIAFNNRSEDNDPSFSIAAPSPYDTGCPLPVRSRAELMQIVSDVKSRIAAGEDTSVTVDPYVTSYELSATAPDVEAAIKNLYSDLVICSGGGRNPYTLRAFSSEVLIPYVTTLLSKSNQNVDEVVNQLLTPGYPGATPTTEYQWEIPEISVVTAADGTIIAAEPLDIFGNGIGSVFQLDGDTWQITGQATLRGEWSTLVMTSNSYSPSCPSTSIHSEDAMKQYLYNLGWNENALPLVATLSSTQLENPEVSDADADAIRTVIDNYRDCLGAGIEPYRFAQGSEAFFGIFASFARAIPSSPISLLGLSSPGELSSVIPSPVTSIVSIDTNKTLAILAASLIWNTSGKVPAIILVNVDGQWLINQLAIVQSPSS